MRVSTDDGRFGLVLNHVADKMFRFQLIIDGRLIGDDDPCILGTAMNELRSLRQFGDERLARALDDPTAVSSLLRADAKVYDVTLLQLAESVDQWHIRAYIYSGQVVILAQEYEDGNLTGPILVSAIDKAEYGSMVDAVYRWWRRVQGDL